MNKPCDDRDVWTIIQYLLPMNSICVLAYDRFADAEYQIKHLRQLNPGKTFKLMTRHDYRWGKRRDYTTS